MGSDIKKRMKKISLLSTIEMKKKNGKNEMNGTRILVFLFYFLSLFLSVFSIGLDCQFWRNVSI